MTRTRQGDLERTKKAAERELPYDPALQQVHIARKIVAREAELEGMSYFDYVKLLAKRRRDEG